MMSTHRKQLQRASKFYVKARVCEHHAAKTSFAGCKEGFELLAQGWEQMARKLKMIRYE